MNKHNILLFVLIVICCMLTWSSYAETGYTCPKCDMIIVSDSKFCSYCGINIKDYNRNKNDYSRTDYITLTPAEAELVKKSKNNMAPYFAVMGAEISNGNPDVSQEFIDNLNSVRMMAYTGSITHGYNQYGNGIYIELITWTSNTRVSITDFYDFVEQMNLYFGSEAILADFTNVADETWQWLDYDEGCDAIAWYENGYINVSWDWVLEVIGEKMPALSPAKQSTATTKPTAAPKPTATSKPTTKPKPTTPKLTKYCTVNGCSHEGNSTYTNPFSGKIEYYCSQHYKEMMANIDYITSYHFCGVEGCKKEGTKSWKNFYGLTEYYCTNHYQELMDALEWFGF